MATVEPASLETFAAGGVERVTGKRRTRTSVTSPRSQSGPMNSNLA